MEKVIYYLFLTIFCIFFLIVPIIPDVQISRPKLLFIEILSYILFSSFVIYSILKNKIIFRKNKFLYFTFLFLVYIIIRYIFSSNKLLAFTELKRFSLSIWLFYSISLINPKHYNILFNFFILGSSLAVIYGLLQYYGGLWILKVPKYDRVMSMFGNPIFFAAYLIIFLPIIFGIYLIEGNKKIKFLYILVLIISGVVIYYTKTRAAFLGIFFSGMFFVYNIYSSKNKFKYLLIILITFFIFVVLTRNIWLRQQAHFLIWRDTLKMWNSNLIFGIGLGEFHTKFVNFASERLRNIWPEKNFIINDAHNEYIQFLAENGILGFIFFVLLIYLFFYSSLKYIKKISFKDKYEFKTKIILTSLLSGCVALLTQNFFSVDLRFIISNIYLFLIMGFVIGFTSEIEEKKLIFDSLIVKFFSLTIVFFLLGIFSISKKTFSMLSLIHFTPQGIKLYIDDVGNGLLQNFLRPYIANYKLKQEKDFFDEKIVDSAKTLEELEELKNKFPNKHIIYERIAWIYAKEKNFNKAIENYLQVIKINPRSYSSYNNLGNIMFVLNNIDKAIEFYKKSIEINPNQVDARINLGIAYYYQGKINLAAEEFNEVLKIDSKNEKAIFYIKKIRE